MKKILISLPLILSLSLVGFATTYSEVANAYVYCNKYCKYTRSGHVVCWRECYRTGWHRWHHRGHWNRWHRW